MNRRSQNTLPPPPRERLSDHRWFEALEERILLSAADPAVTLAVDPNDTQMIGEPVTLDLSLTNASGTDTGFSPFVNLFLETTGADGPASPDGLSFSTSDFLGGPLPSTTVTFDALGQVTHPVTGTIINAPAGFGEGDTMVVLQFPLGSFAPNQSVNFSVDVDISNFADLGAPLNISAQGGFALGCDPLDNPGVDPPIFGGLVSTTVTPQLINTTKTILAPEAETSTGPNFPQTWQIEIDLADGQTLANFNFQDFVPPDLVYLGNLTVTGAAGLTNANITSLVEPPVGGLPLNPPASEINFDLGNVTGTTSPTDVVVTFDFYVNDVDADGNPVLPLGGDSASTNTVDVTGDWTPLDPLDAQTPIADSDSAVLQQEGPVIRKSASLQSDPDGFGLSAGDTIEYTLTVNISDYLTTGDLIITDSLGDGQSFDAGFTPTFQVNERGTVTNGDFNLIDTGLATEELATTANNAAGIETLTFDLSQAMVNQGLDDLLIGGLVNGGAFGGTTATITFRATVDPSFAGPVAGDASVSQGDDLDNNVVLNTSIRDNTTPANVISNQSDDSSSTLTIATGALSKDLYAVNGTIGGSGANLQVGDTLTYRLTYTLPLTEFENFTIDDFLSQPIIDLGVEPVAFALGGGNPPAAGVATFGPNDTFFGVTGITPTLSEPGGNVLRFDMGDFDPVGPQASTLELLFTVTIQDAAFADNLPLSNQASSTEANTATSPIGDDAIVSVNLAAPNLNIRKGVVTAIENSPNVTPGLAFDDTTAPPGVTFQAPGVAAGAAFTGTVSSANLGTTLNANASGLDAGDLVKFVIVVQNVGDDDAFDVLIQDSIPNGFVAPGVGANGINLKVTDGAGNAFAGFTPTVNATSIQIELTDGATGSIQDSITGAGTPGSDIAIITYDLQVQNLVALGVGSTLTNTASVDEYAAIEGGRDRSTDPSDTAAVTLSSGEFVKSIVSTSRTDTGSDALPAALDFHDMGVEDLAIGETVTYRLVYSMPESTDTITIVDDLPDVFSLVSSRVVSIGANITGSALAVGAAGTANDVNLVDGRPDQAVFNFGLLQNAEDGAINADDQIVVEITALVENLDPANLNGQLKTNTGTVQFTGGSLSDTVDVNIVEPNLDVFKSVAPNTGDAGDTVTYTLQVAHDPNSTLNAYDLSLLDPLVAGVTITAGTLNTASTDPLAVFTVNSGNAAGDTIDIDVSQLALGQTITVTFDATLDATVTPGSTLNNRVDLPYDNTPGADPNQRSDSDFDTATVTVTSPSFSKSILTTSVTQTGSGEHLANPDLAIGETVTFELVFVVPEGVTSSLVITDNLPTTNGVLELLSSTVSAFGANLTSANGLGVGSAGVASDSNLVDGLNDRAVFDFGQVTNTANNVLDAGDEIRIQVVARVADVPANADGDTLTNSATADFGTGMVTDTADVDIVEPVLNIAKAASTTDLAPGDTFTYTLTVTHDAASTSSAFDLSITDLLADPLISLVPASVVVVGGSGVVVNSGNGAGDSTIDVTIGELALAQMATITYTVQVAAGAPLATTINNTGDLGFDSLPGSDPNERGGTDSDSEQVRTEPDLSKAFFGSDLGDAALQVGETVTYRVTTTVGEGDSDLTLVDNLPDTLQLVSSQVVSVGANLGGIAVGLMGVAADVNLVDGQPDQVTYNLGTLTNVADGVVNAADQFVIEVVARVADTPANVDGNTDINTATLTFSDPNVPGSGGSKSDTATTTVVEPILQIQKATTSNSGDAGDTVTFTLTISHTGASTGDAYDVVVDDLLADANLALVPGTVSILTAPAGGAAIASGNGGADTTLQITAPSMLLGETLVIQYDATVLVSATPLSNVVNQGDVGFDSFPGPGGRPGTDSDTETFRVDGPSLNKQVSGTGDSGTSGTDLFIGETVIFDLRVTLPEGTNPTVVITDFLPKLPGQGTLQLLSSEVLAIGANLAGSALSVGDPGVPTDTDANTTIDAVVFDFTSGGPVVNNPDGVVTADDQILLRVVARVPKGFGNEPGDVLRNTAQFDFGSGIITDSATVQLVPPPTAPVVPPPPPVTVFDLYSFTAFEDFRIENERLVSWTREELHRPLLPPLTLDPLYSGTAEPGATLHLTIFNPLGQVIGSKSVVVDAGGNWVARFPSATLHSTDPSTDQGRLEGSRLFQGRGQEFAKRDAFGFERTGETSTHGTILYQQPHALRVVQTRPSFHTTDEAGQNQRTYFTSPSNDLHFVQRPVTLDRVFEERASHSVQLLKEGSSRPLGLGWNKFDEEFLGEPGQPSGR